MYNLIGYSDNYSKTSGILWQYCSNESTSAVDSTITDFSEANAITDLFTIKEKVTVQTGNNGTENVKIMVPLKYLSNFWSTFEMSLINCEIKLDLNWCKNCCLVATMQIKTKHFE